MRKSLVLICLSFFVAFGSYAQCVVDTAGLATKNVTPDSLPCVVSSQAFNGTISIKIPATMDAHTFVATIPAGTFTIIIDSVQINSISGMPSGITQVSTPSNGTWLKPGNYACAHFTGTTTAAAGRYNLTFSGTGCGHFTALGTTYDSCIQNFNFAQVYPYHLSVCAPAGVSEISADLGLSIYPNPNQGAFTVTVSSADRLTGEMTVVDALGRRVHTSNIDVTGVQQLPLNLHNAAAGVYTLMINAGGKQSVKQFIVQ